MIRFHVCEFISSKEGWKKVYDGTIFNRTEYIISKGKMIYDLPYAQFWNWVNTNNYTVEFLD